jgi:hypothetical protein
MYIMQSQLEIRAKMENNMYQMHLVVQVAAVKVCGMTARAIFLVENSHLVGSKPYFKFIIG